MKTGTKVIIGAVAVAAVGGIAYLWSKGKAVADTGVISYGQASVDTRLPAYSSLRRQRPQYSRSMPTGITLTGLV